MLSTMEKILFLNKVPIFEGMTSEQLRIISQICAEEEFLDGENIAEQGDWGDRMYIIIEGSVDILKEGEDGTETHVATTGRNEIVGEMATITETTRTATIRANKDVKTLSIPKEPFRELIREYPDLSFEIFRVLTKRLNDTSALIEQYIQQGKITR